MITERADAALAACAEEAVEPVELLALQLRAEDDPYSMQMRDVFRFANVSASRACLQRRPRAPWRCIVGMEPLEFLPAVRIGLDPATPG